MFVIMRTNQTGGYVTIQGHKYSYSHNVNVVRLYDTKEEAEQDCCKGNEIVLPASECFRVVY